MYLDLLEAQGMTLDTRLMVIEARAARDKRLAELEALMGTDAEMLASSPSVVPTLSQSTTTAREEAPPDR